MCQICIWVQLIPQEMWAGSFDPFSAGYWWLQGSGRSSGSPPGGLSMVSPGCRWWSLMAATRRSPSRQSPSSFHCCSWLHCTTIELHRAPASMRGSRRQLIGGCNEADHRVMHTATLPLPHYAICTPCTSPCWGSSGSGPSHPIPNYMYEDDLCFVIWISVLIMWPPRG